MPGAHPAKALEGDFERAHVLFPAVGLAIGSWIALVRIAAGQLGLPGLASAGIALLSGALLTGALHEDGLADMADGFGGGRDRHHKLEIMRDSRIGTYGALAICCVLIIKASVLAEADGRILISRLAVAHALSRTSATVLSSILPPARADGLAASAGKTRAHIAAASTCCSVIAGLALLPPGRMGSAFAAAALVVCCLAWLARRQVGGVTGDVLGATQQLTEVAILLALTAKPIYLI